MEYSSIYIVAGVALGLGCDAFAVALAVGTGMPGLRASIRLSFHFGLFQFLMPLIGWGLGNSLLVYIHAFDHWVAFAILAVVSISMVVESFRLPPVEEPSGRRDPTRGWSLVGLSVATSLDALGVGVSMGIVKSTLLYPAVVIGITAALMTYAGIILGRRLTSRFGQRVQLFGAAILALIAFKLLSI